MPVSFSRFSGPYEYDDRQLTKASTAIAVGNALRENTGLAPAISGSEIFGIAMQAKASSVSAQTPILIMWAYPNRTRFYGARGSGTLSAADVNTRVDLSSEAALACDVTTNKDFLLTVRLSADEAVGMFSNTVTVNV